MTSTRCPHTFDCSSKRGQRLISVGQKSLNALRCAIIFRNKPSQYDICRLQAKQTSIQPPGKPFICKILELFFIQLALLCLYLFFCHCDFSCIVSPQFY